MRFRCPHCGTRSVVRTSLQMSPTVTWLYVQCRSIDCGHTWRVDAEATVTISPSAQPNLGVEMQLSQHVQRDRIGVQMATARPGDHQPSKPNQPDLPGINMQDGDRAPLPDRAPALTRP